jgi:hypothetical protein
MDCSISTAVPTGSSASIGTPRLGLVPVGDRRYSLGRLPDNARMARCRRRTRRENLHLKDLNRDQRGPSGKTSMVLPPPRAADVHCAAGRLLIWSRCQSPSFDLASWPRMKTAATEWSGEHGLDQHSLPTTRDPVSGVVRLATEEKVRNLKAWRKIAPVADHKPRRDCSISEDPGEAMDPVGLLAERYVTIAVAIGPECPNTARCWQGSLDLHEPSGQDIPLRVGGRDFVPHCCCSNSAKLGLPSRTQIRRAALATFFFHSLEHHGRQNACASTRGWKVRRQYLHSRFAPPSVKLVTAHTPRI